MKRRCCTSGPTVWQDEEESPPGLPQWTLSVVGSTRPMESHAHPAPRAHTWVPILDTGFF